MPQPSKMHTSPVITSATSSVSDCVLISQAGTSVPTPPVALAAYAAAGMAGSDPFKTGNMAFRLGMAKALVPFVFVFSPSLLIVAKGFTGYDFVVTFVGCVLGNTLLAAALSKYFLVEMTRGEQVLCAVAAILMIAPGLVPTLIGLALALPMVLRHAIALRR